MNYWAVVYVVGWVVLITAILNYDKILPKKWVVWINTNIGIG